MQMESLLNSIIKVIKHPPLGGGLVRNDLFFPFLLFGIFTLFLSSCAKMGQPDGGWYDETPPRVLGESPYDGATDVNGKKISIYFDEFIKLDNPTEKVVVSPPQLEAPEIKNEGKRIVVKLQDSLRANTTYTIDFSDAISDNNEGNPLGNYTYTFSTGDHIDTMQVAGYVVDARTLEPVQGILVGLYDNLSDTAFTKLPMLRVSRTDENGHYSIKGVRNGQYHVFALQDVDGNYMFNAPTEKIAFDSTIYNTTCGPDIRQDTIWGDSLHIRDIVRVPYTHFYPDNVVLRAFTEEQTNRYFIKSERSNADHFTLFFSYGDTQLPKVTGLNFNADDAFIIEPSMNADTITYWLRDTTLVNQDTLRMQLDYRVTDSTGVLVPQTDTLELLSKQPYEKRMKAKKAAYEKWQKQQDKNRKRGKAVQDTMPAEALEPEFRVNSTLDPDQNPSVSMPSPLATIDSTKIHLYCKQDTSWVPMPFQFGEVPGQPRVYRFVGAWRPGGQYSLETDSAAFVDIYGLASKAGKNGFKVPKEEEYNTFPVRISGFDGKKIYVQLLNNSGKTLKEQSTSDGSVVFQWVKPGTYYLSMYVDENENGRWDTGDYSQQRQPEPVYYYNDKIERKAKWDDELSWSPLSVPLNRQKPNVLVKKKANTQRQVSNRNAERARRLGIQYIQGQTN